MSDDTTATATTDRFYFYDLARWLTAATENGFKVEADDKVQTKRRALDDNRKEMGSYDTAESRGSLITSSATPGAHEAPRAVAAPDYGKPTDFVDSQGAREAQTDAERLHAARS